MPTKIFLLKQITRNLLKIQNKLLTSLVKRKSHASNDLVLDVEIVKGQGVTVWDKNGKEYLDFIAGQGSLPLGHCPLKFLQVMQEQMYTLHLSTNVQNNILSDFCQYLCQTFNYDKVLLSTTGSEAIEVSLKLARIWGYKIKKICPRDAVIVFCHNNFHGCTISSLSGSTDPLIFSGFQPLLNGLKLIPYNDSNSLEEILGNPNVCGFIIEPIQIEAGVDLPTDGYLAEVRRLCTQNQVLWLGDETFTGLCRTGHMLAVDYECVKPDILILSKALGGGLYPVSATLASSEVIDLIKPGAHKSTFGGNPLAAKIAKTVLKTLKEEKIYENVQCMGALFKDGLLCSINKEEMPQLRSRGLLTCIKIDPRIGSPAEVCDNLRHSGLLAWPMKDEYIRFTPPLIVTEDEVTHAIAIIRKVIDYMKGRV